MVLSLVHDLLAPRYPQLAVTLQQLHQAETDLAAHASHERIDADISELCELLAPVAVDPRAEEDAMSGNVGRRGFLAGAAAAIGGTALAGASASASSTATAAPAFHGIHQAGIVTDRQRNAAFVAFDVVARDRAELAELMRASPTRARLLTAGGTPASLGIAAPPPDSGTARARPCRPPG